MVQTMVEHVSDKHRKDADEPDGGDEARVARQLEHYDGKHDGDSPRSSHECGHSDHRKSTWVG